MPLTYDLEKNKYILCCMQSVEFIEEMRIRNDV